MKEQAKKSYLKTLSNEMLELDLGTLSDQELKRLYVKWQHLKQGYCKYQAPKKMDFDEALQNGELQFVSFKGTPGVRPLTFKEYLKLEEFVQTREDMYPHFRRSRH